MSKPHSPDQPAGASSSAPAHRLTLSSADGLGPVFARENRRRVLTPAGASGNGGGLTSGAGAAYRPGSPWRHALARLTRFTRSLPARYAAAMAPLRPPQDAGPDAASSPDRPRVGRRPWVRYGLPVLAVGVAHVLTQLAWPLFRHNVSLLFITAVMISALYGGLGPGLWASALAGLASAFVFLPPVYSLQIEFNDFLRLGVFIFVAVLISWLSAARAQSELALRRAQAELEERVRDRTAALVVANRGLENEVAERRRAEERILAYQQRLQSLATELSVTEARERRRIATDLHDAIGHRLAVAVIKLRGLLQTLGPARVPTDAAAGSGGSAAGNGAVAETVERACELVEQTIRHTRSLTLELSPPILYELGLGPAIEWLAEQVEQEHGFAIEVRVEEPADAGSGGGAARDVSEEVRVLMFSAVRELLMNIVKHAAAGAVTITLRPDGPAGRDVRVSVEDDGRGFEPGRLESGGGGFGLFNIRERLTHLGGRFELDSQPGRGTRVTLVAPRVAGRGAAVPERIELAQQPT